MSSQVETISTLASSLNLKNCIQLNINSEFLEMNFDLIKKCLLKVSDLQNDLKAQKVANQAVLERLNSAQHNIQENRELINNQDLKLKDIQHKLGEDFMKKIEELEEKTRNTHDVEKLAKQLQRLDLFVVKETFNELEGKVIQNTKQIENLKNEFAKYVQQGNFDHFKDQISRDFKESENAICTVKEDQKVLQKKIDSIDDKANSASKEVAQNTAMMKEINFNEMQIKIRKFKEDIQGKLGEMIVKLKKKVGGVELMEVQKNIIDKIDKFLLGENAKADKDETKEALTFLEKRINEIYEMYGAEEDKDESDPMFTTRKWMCASCAKDLGKFQGKLNQFKPWSVFPCRQLDPEKTGGYGYLNYVDKMAYKRGFSIDDSNMQRLNKTFYQRNRDSPKKMNSTRATNFMSNYGTSEKHSMSLKEEYFKAQQEKGARFFRVKKDIKRQTHQNEKQKVKQI